MRIGSFLRLRQKHSVYVLVSIPSLHSPWYVVGDEGEADGDAEGEAGAAGDGDGADGAADEDAVTGVESTYHSR